jgi:Tfp pilus assembly protein PilF
MEPNRLDKLFEILRTEAGDPFILYAIALEYLALKDSKNAELFFNKILEDYENYIPVYFHAAAFYSENGKREKADAVYRKGIQLAREKNELHALKELKSAYTNFMLESD